MSWCPSWAPSLLITISLVSVESWCSAASETEDLLYVWKHKVDGWNVEAILFYIYYMQHFIHPRRCRVTTINSTLGSLFHFGNSGDMCLSKLKPPPRILVLCRDGSSPMPWWILVMYMCMLIWWHVSMRVKAVEGIWQPFSPNSACVFVTPFCVIHRISYMHRHHVISQYVLSMLYVYHIY